MFSAENISTDVTFINFCSGGEEVILNKLTCLLNQVCYFVERGCLFTLLSVLLRQVDLLLFLFLLFLPSSYTQRSASLHCKNEGLACKPCFLALFEVLVFQL